MDFMKEDSAKQFRIGIVGAGLIGSKRITAFRSLGCNVVAILDPDVSRARSLIENQQLSSNAKVESELDSLIGTVGSGGIVVVATPHVHLASIATAVASKGCHVLLEKPGATSSLVLEELKLVAEANKSVVRVGYNHRFHPGIRSLRDAVMSGKFGRVLLSRGTYGHGGRIGYQDEWRFKPEISGGGELLDQGSHLLDLVQHVTGDRLLYQYSNVVNLYWGGSVEDNAFLSLSGESHGFQAWLHASWTEWKNRFLLEVFCERAKLEVSGLGGSYGPEAFKIYEMGDNLGPPEIQSIEYPPGDDSWKQECAAFLDAIEHRSSAGATIDDAASVLRIIERAYREC